MTPGGRGTRQDNITTDQASPKEGVDTLADGESAMTPRDVPDEGEDDTPAYRDEEE